MLGMLVAFATLAFGTQPKDQPRDDVEQILALHQAVLDAHKAGDVESLLAAEPDDIVRVSDDGTLGWLIAQVEIIGTQAADQAAGDDERVRIDSVWAWIELYEKKDGRWYRVGDVSNVRPRDME
jgi:hypothetical protein